MKFLCLIALTLALLASVACFTLNGREEGIAGFIRVKNGGAYVARFNLEFYLRGELVSYGTDNYVYTSERRLDLPLGATNITVSVDRAVFIATWRSIFTEFYPTPVTKCFEVGGRPLSPSWSENRECSA